MKKKKKSRVNSVGFVVLQGTRDNYYLTVPYDSKNRIIPSSVECAYNADYYSLSQTEKMVKVL